MLRMHQIRFSLDPTEGAHDPSRLGRGILSSHSPPPSTTVLPRLEFGGLLQGLRRIDALE